MFFQRTQTLMKEYKERDKANVFADKRLGEYDSGISPEDRMLKRFSLEQQVCQQLGSNCSFFCGHSHLLHPQAPKCCGQGKGWWCQGHRPVTVVPPLGFDLLGLLSAGSRM